MGIYCTPWSELIHQLMGSKGTGAMLVMHLTLIGPREGEFVKHLTGIYSESKVSPSCKNSCF